MKGKILIVDDQYGIRVLLQEVLQKEGYNIFQAANGHQALAITREEDPDLVLLDMKIPDMDGIEILKELKKFNPKIRVIILTAYGEMDLIETALNLGALAHFQKPFDITQIRDVAKQYITMDVDT